MLTPELKKYLETLWEKYPEPIFEGNEEPLDRAMERLDRLNLVTADLVNKAKELYGDPRNS